MKELINVNSGKLKTRKTLSVEELNYKMRYAEAYAEKVEMNILMLGGVLDIYYHRVYHRIKELKLDEQKVSGQRPFKHFLLKIEKARKQIRQQERRIAFTGLARMITSGIPGYEDEFASRVDLAQVFQLKYIEEHREEIDCAHKISRDVVELGVDCANELYADMYTLLYILTVMLAGIHDLYQYMYASAKEIGCKLAPGRLISNAPYETLWKVIDTMLRSTSNEKSFSEQECKEISNKLTSAIRSWIEVVGANKQVVFASIKEVEHTYTNYAVARMIIDVRNGRQLPKALQKIVLQQMEDVPRKQLMKRLRILGGVYKSDDPFDLMDELEGHKYSEIERLKLPSSKMIEKLRAMYEKVQKQ